jgi:catechol 2,3-dioxygenase-like lactoylglutathione lyase family enzyme
MKRLHVHLSVEDIGRSVQFYETLFGQPPSVRNADYAKWMLDDPRVNFAISQLGHAPGLDHLGLQVESADELRVMTDALAAANLAVQRQSGTTCCYAKSDKGWVHDPQGIPWESFFTHGNSTTYGVDRSPRSQATGACCAPAAPAP